MPLTIADARSWPPARRRAAQHRRRGLRDRPSRGALRRLRPLRHRLPDRRQQRGETFDSRQLFDAPPESRRGALGAALRRVARHAPAGPIEVPARVTVFRTIVYDDEQLPGLRHLRPRLPDRGHRGAAAEGGPRAIQ